MSEEDLVEFQRMCQAFGSLLVSWNLEEPEGHPVPATLDGLMSMDLEFINVVIMAWLSAVEHGGQSAVPEDFDEASLPVEALTP